MSTQRNSRNGSAQLGLAKLWALDAGSEAVERVLATGFWLAPQRNPGAVVTLVRACRPEPSSASLSPNNAT